MVVQGRMKIGEGAVKTTTTQTSLIYLHSHQHPTSAPPNASYFFTGD